MFEGDHFYPDLVFYNKLLRCFVIRKEKNMTQQELADKLCVIDRAVSHWEN